MLHIYNTLFVPMLCVVIHTIRKCKKHGQHLLSQQARTDNLFTYIDVVLDVLTSAKALCAGFPINTPEILDGAKSKYDTSCLS